MSVFNAVSKLFGGSNSNSANSQTNPQAAQAQTANPAVNQNGGTTAGNIPNVPITKTDAAGNPAVVENPGIADFSKIWETDPNAKPPQSTDAFPNVDRAKLTEAFRAQDFLKTVPKEMLAVLAAGGQEAINLIPQLINQASQNSAADTTFATTKLINEALKQQEAKFKEMLPDLVKKHTASDTLRSTNPAFNDPTVAPMVTMVQDRLAVKYPNATASELNKMAQDYMSQAFSKFAPQPQKQETTNKQQETDWGSFLDNSGSSLAGF